MVPNTTIKVRPSYPRVGIISFVFWAQAAVSFLIWIGYGVYQGRRSAQVRAWSRSVSRSSRGLQAAGLFLVGGAALVGGLYATWAGNGLTDSGFAAWAWGVITVAGLILVHTQTLGLALMVTAAQEAVTAERAEASRAVGTDDEAASP